MVLIWLMPNMILGHHDGEVLLQEVQDSCDSRWSKGPQNTICNVGAFDWFLGSGYGYNPRASFVTLSEPASKVEGFQVEEMKGG